MTGRSGRRPDGTAWRDPLLCSAIYVGINIPDLLRTHEILECRHAPFQTSLAHNLKKLLLRIHRAARTQRYEQVGCHRVRQHVLAVASRAVHAVLPPSIILGLTHLRSRSTTLGSR